MGDMILFNKVENITIQSKPGYIKIESIMDTTTRRLTQEEIDIIVKKVKLGEL